MNGTRWNFCNKPSGEGLKFRETLKKVLAKKTNCEAQHDGWPCGTCFFSMSDDLNNQDWQTLLLFRGDYSQNELDNLPISYDESLDKIMKIAIEA